MPDSADFDDNADPVETLTHFAANPLRLLLGERSLAINRAAISELGGAPELSEVLLAQGRHRTGPIVEAYLARLAGQGRLPPTTRPRRSGCCTGWSSGISRSAPCWASASPPARPSRRGRASPSSSF